MCTVFQYYYLIVIAHKRQPCLMKRPLLLVLFFIVTDQPPRQFFIFCGIKAVKVSCCPARPVHAKHLFKFIAVIRVGWRTYSIKLGDDKFMPVLHILQKLHILRTHSAIDQDRSFSILLLTIPLISV